MTARSYLFVSRATIDWCVGRYLASDHPENILTWRSLPPFADSDGVQNDEQRNAYAHTVRTRQRLLDALLASRNANPFSPENWTYIDVSTWFETTTTNPRQGEPTTDEKRLATMSRQSISFVGSLTDSTPTIQWGHVCDPELAKAWLDRAMKFTPAQIDAMSPGDQRQACDDAWASFALFWKAINLAPQGWEKYRDAWEFFARPPYAPAVLSNSYGERFPRPTRVPIWPPKRREFFPEDAPKYLGPWRWEAMLANEVFGENQNGLVGRSQWDATVNVTYGGSLRVTQTDGTPTPSHSCQDLVIYGGMRLPSPVPSPISCFAPMGEAHMYWLDNAAMLGGGMETVWTSEEISARAPSGFPARSLLVRCPPNALDVDAPASAFYGVQPFVNDVSTGAAGTPATPTSLPWSVSPGAPLVPFGPTRRSGPQTWRDGRLISTPGADPFDTSSSGEVPRSVSDAGTFAPAWYYTDYVTWRRAPPRVWWQPPAKRYMDLLWPLLVYLSSRTIEEIIYEVKMDVLGKNGYSLFARGGSSDGGTDALDAAAGVFQTSMQRARESAEAQQSQIRNDASKLPKLVLAITGTLATAVTSVVATPAAGAAVAAGFALLNGAIQLSETASRTHAWVNVGFDVFGRPDGMAGQGALAGFSLGNYERFAIYNVRPASSRGFDGSETDAVKSLVYTSMRLRARVGTTDSIATGWTGYREGLVAPAGAGRDPAPPYPAGFSLSLVILPGMLGTVAPRPEISTSTTPSRRLQNLDPKPPVIDPGTAAAAAIAGLAIGAVASEVTRGR